MRKVSKHECQTVTGGWTYSQTCSKCGYTYSQNYYEIFSYICAMLNVDKAYSLHYCKQKFVLK